MRKPNNTIAVISSFTRDIIRRRGEEKSISRIGGPAYYISLTLKSLGYTPLVITSISNTMLYHISKLPIKTCIRRDINDFVFELVYRGDSRDTRLLSKGMPIPPEHIEKCLIHNHREPIRGIIVSPVYDEISYDTLEIITRYSIKHRISLSGDLQGFLRSRMLAHSSSFSSIFDIVHVEWCEAIEHGLCVPTEDILGCVKKLSSSMKAVVLLTMGSHGSTIGLFSYAIKVPVYGPLEGDATGSGDVYLAAYFASRLSGYSLVESGVIASVMAGMNVAGKLDLVDFSTVEDVAWMLKNRNNRIPLASCLSCR